MSQTEHHIDRIRPPNLLRPAADSREAKLVDLLLPRFLYQQDIPAFELFHRHPSDHVLHLVDIHEYLDV